MKSFSTNSNQPRIKLLRRRSCTRWPAWWIRVWTLSQILPKLQFTSTGRRALNSKNSATSWKGRNWRSPQIECPWKPIAKCLLIIIWRAHWRQIKEKSRLRIAKWRATQAITLQIVSTYLTLLTHLRWVWIRLKWSIHRSRQNSKWTQLLSTQAGEPVSYTALTPATHVCPRRSCKKWRDEWTAIASVTTIPPRWARNTSALTRWVRHRVN